MQQNKTYTLYTKQMLRARRRLTQLPNQRIKILYFPFKNYHFLQELYKVKIYKICDSLIQLHHLQVLAFFFNYLNFFF